MNAEQSFSDVVYEHEIHVADRELAAFIGAVTELFGPVQARFSAEDWLDESELMDSPPRSTCRDWRAVTVAATARLADRLIDVPDHRASPETSPGAPPAASSNTKVSPIPSSNCFAPALLV